MITDSRLKRIARRHNINPYYQEKDYLQNIFLYQLTGREELVFKGGTCLKLCYNLPRFSEDLDFNTSLEPGEIESMVKDALQGFRQLGIEVTIERSQTFKETSSYTAHLRLKGPLYNGNKSSTNTIQIDAGKRTGTVLAPNVRQVSSPYPDLPSYFLSVMQLKEILAEKIAAMASRSQGKDLFDVWFLLHETELSISLLEQKVELKRGTMINMPSEADYMRDVSDLLPDLPPYPELRSEVEDKLEDKGLEVE